MRNLVVSRDGDVILVDWDKATIGPAAWDLALVALVLNIHDRRDLWLNFADKFPAVKTEEFAPLYAVRLVQSIVHTACNIDFETEQGYVKRIEMAADFFADPFVVKQ